MLPAQLLFFRTKSVAHAFVVPALCKRRKGRGTRAGMVERDPSRGVQFERIGAVNGDSR
jgi:hypothetical protein